MYEKVKICNFFGRKINNSYFRTNSNDCNFFTKRQGACRYKVYKNFFLPISHFPLFPFPFSIFLFPLSSFPFTLYLFLFPFSSFPFPLSPLPFTFSSFPFPRFPFPLIFGLKILIFSLKIRIFGLKIHIFVYKQVYLV